MGKTFVVLFLALFFVPIKMLAQENSSTQRDTIEVFEMKPIIVTADRIEGPLMLSTAAVYRMQGEELRRQPVTDLADAMRLVPGFVFLNLDGLGYDPQPTIRGFYGGGEAGYVQLLLNGKPMNTLGRGAVNWNLVIPARVDAIEVLRGSASSLYGSAALGGVINLVMKEDSASFTQGAVKGGSYGTFSGRLQHGGMWKGRNYTLFGHAEGTEGYREHAVRRLETLGGSVELMAARGHELKLYTVHHWRDSEIPGPLTGSALDSARRQVASFYRFDGIKERLHQLALDDEVQLSESVDLSSYLSGRLRRVDKIRTLSLAPGFADTRNRSIASMRLQGSTQITFDQLPLQSDLILGLEGSLGSIETKYYGFLSGTVEAYRTAVNPERGALDDTGEGSRDTFAAFFQYNFIPVERLRFSLGARYDYLRDTFQSVAPEQGMEMVNIHTAFSPKVGINYRYLRSARHMGNLYANISRVFKAPTLDQFYDQRLIRMPMENVSLSSPNLEPQRGTSFEVGVYHRATFIPGAFSAELSLAVYQINMRNEIDFSLQELSYINIGKSSHRGIEAGLTLFLPAQIKTFVNYTHQSVVLKNGAFEGNYVKAIPRNAFNAGISAMHSSGLSGSLLVSGAYDIYLDDANMISLPGHTSVDLRLAYRYGKITVEAEAFNLLNQKYSTTGYPDPSGQTDLVYYYPAAGRSLRLGLVVNL